MNTTNLFKMYKQDKFQPTLPEGEYKVTMISQEYVPAKTADSSDYVKFQYKLVDKDRTITDNKFERGFAVMVSHLRQQLKRSEEEIIPMEFFQELIDNKTELKIWITKPIINGRTRININFLKPIEQTETKPNTTVVDDDVLDEKPNTDSKTVENNVPETK